MAITPLPTPPSRAKPSDFSTKADALLGALPVFVTEANAQAAALTLNATNDTSTSSNAVGLGAKTFTVTAGKSFQPGMWLVIADTGAPSGNQMIGSITSYSGTTLVMYITQILGSGTKTAWKISMSGPSGTGKVTLTQPANGSTLTIADGKTLTVSETSEIAAELHVTAATHLDEAVAMSSKMAKTGSNLAIGSDADGDMYYRSGGVLARLAKGTANLMLFMNAAGTFPEWGPSSKSGAISRDLNAAGGNVSYTGIGFKPSGIFGIGLWDNSFCYWQYTAGADMEMMVYGTTPTYYGSTNEGVTFVNATGSLLTKATLVSFNADGFTLAWAGTPQVGLGTFAYVALR